MSAHNPSFLAPVWGFVAQHWFVDTSSSRLIVVGAGVSKFYLQKNVCFTTNNTHKLLQKVLKKKVQCFLLRCVFVYVCMVVTNHKEGSNQWQLSKTALNAWSYTRYFQNRKPKVKKKYVWAHTFCIVFIHRFHFQAPKKFQKKNTHNTAMRNEK